MVQLKSLGWLFNPDMTNLDIYSANIYHWPIQIEGIGSHYMQHLKVKRKEYVSKVK